MVCRGAKNPKITVPELQVLIGAKRYTREEAALTLEEESGAKFSRTQPSPCRLASPTPVMSPHSWLGESRVSWWLWL